MKKVITILLALVFLLGMLSMTGCGEQKEPAAKTEDVKANEPAPVKPAPAAEPADAPKDAAEPAS